MISNDSNGEKSPLVSVIIPTHNYGHFLSETLNSVLCQTYNNWECIVIDNGSTDNTRTIVQNFIQFDPRFRYIKIEHSTTSKSRNEGIKNASGMFIQFLDSDDQIEKGKLSNQVELFQQHPNAGLVYSHALYYDSGNPTNLRLTHDESNVAWIPTFTGNSWEMLSTHYKRNIFVVSSPLIKKSLVEQVGGFYAPLNWVEDWEFWLRVLAVNTLMVYDNSPESASLIRVHSKSLSRNRLKMYQQSLIARKQLMKLLNTLKIKGFENAHVLIKDNSAFEAYLYRLLYQESLPSNKLNAFQYLYSYAKRKKDWKIMGKFISGLFTKKFPVFFDPIK